MSKSYGVRSITRPVLGQPGNSWEPPSADPHARWCGGRGRKTPGYPIRRSGAEASRRIFPRGIRTPRSGVRTAPRMSCGRGGPACWDTAVVSSVRVMDGCEAAGQQAEP